MANMDLAIIEKLEKNQLSAVSDRVVLAKPLGEFIDDYIKAAGGGSDNTARAYMTAAGLFLQYLDQERGDKIPPELADWRPFATTADQVLTDKRGREYKKTIWEFRGSVAIIRFLVDAAALDGFRSWRLACGDNQNSASARVYAVRALLSVALSNNILTTDQAQRLGIKPYKQRQKRDNQPVGRRLSIAEVKALRSAVDPGTVKGKRDRALLDLQLYAGLRCEEVATLAVENLKHDGGRWWLVFSGKGDKTRRVKCHDVLYKSLQDWIKAAGIENGIIFKSVNKGDKVNGHALNTGSIARVVNEYGAAAKLAPLGGNNQLSPHDLRRTCARNAYDNGAGLLLIQAMLGHADPKTTARYIGAFEDDNNTAIDYVRY